MHTALGFLQRATAGDLGFTFQGAAMAFAGIAALYLARMVLKIDKTVTSLVQTIEGNQGLLRNVTDLQKEMGDLRKAMGIYERAWSARNDSDTAFRATVEILKDDVRRVLEHHTEPPLPVDAKPEAKRRRQQ